MVTKRSCFCSYWPALWPLTNSFDASTERTVNPFNALRHRPSFKVFKQTPLDGPNCREASKSYGFPRESAHLPENWTLCDHFNGGAATADTCQLACCMG